MVQHYYAYTIKCIRKDYSCTLRELIDVRKELMQKYETWFSDEALEFDSMGRRHLHGYFEKQKTITYNKYRKSGWTIFITKLQTEQDVKRWRKYIHKTDGEGPCPSEFEDYHASLMIGEVQDPMVIKEYEIWSLQQKLDDLLKDKNITI